LVDGGFRKTYEASSTISDVVNFAFNEGQKRYPSLFTSGNPYEWFRPSEQALVDVLYDLSNTYLSGLSDDILGDIYQKQLTLSDRKMLGQYYTPRDIIRLIWDLVAPEKMSQDRGGELFPLKVYDFATGSGGFLVSYAGRRKSTILRARDMGAKLDHQAIVNQLAESMVGTEISQFSAYLTEVNLVMQLAQLLEAGGEQAVPELNIFCVDSLTAHNPSHLETSRGDRLKESTLVRYDRSDALERLISPSNSSEWFDICVGNPPYIGEKLMAQTKANLMKRHPYWKQFSAAHQDYLYYFMILGISKLRQGGRFGFITTEYWLKATGAEPLREFLALNCEIDNFVLFRNMNLFPDAPGQHNLIVTGTRTTSPTSAESVSNSSKPRVSIYVGSEPNLGEESREQLLNGISEGRNSPKTLGLVSFRSQRSPGQLLGNSWAEVIMTKDQIDARNALSNHPSKVEIQMSEGVIATPLRLRQKHLPLVSRKTADEFSHQTDGLGVFELNDREYQGLLEAGLTKTEKMHLKRVVNTKDVFPYATVAGDDKRWLIWLPYRGDKRFPEDMPVLFDHLKQFRELLEDVIQGYKAKRPWWSVHNPRVALFDGHEGGKGWSDLALTSRWGDRKLVSGLMPQGMVPSSSLHAFTGQSLSSSASYLVGILNSSLVAGIASAIAPGSISQDDIRDLGLPLLPKKFVKGIEDLTLELADEVENLVQRVSKVFPEIPDCLRKDIQFSDSFLSAWSPLFGSHVIRASVIAAKWLKVETHSPSGRIRSVRLVDDIFGQHVEVTCDQGKIELAPVSMSRSLLEMIAVFCRGHVDWTVDEFLQAGVHMTEVELRSGLQEDIRMARGAQLEYRRRREAIDELFSEGLSLNRRT
jgi:hypothetical protein